MKQRARSADKKQEKKEKLLEAASRLFRERGYAGTTIGMITAEVALSPGAFYRYFSGKTEIYRTLTAMGLAILAEGMGKAGGSAGADPVARLRAAALAYLDFYLRHRDYYDIVAVLHLGQGEFFSDPRGVRELEASALSLLGIIESAVRDGAASGAFRAVDPWKTAVALWGIIDGVLLLDVKGSTGFTGVAVEELFAAAVDLALGGLRG